MAHLLEPKQELLSPEYWGGVDINNPNHFTVPYVEPTTPTRSEHRIAAGQLARVLTDIVNDGGTEFKSHMRPEFDPSNTQLEDGSVVILDQEQLYKWVDRKDKKDSPRYPRTSDTPPITSPFVDYWRSNLGFVKPGGSTHFGDEEAFFEAEEAMYGRHLSWGVLTTAKSGLRMICTWGISVPKYREGLGVGVLGGDKWFRLARALPLEVGVAEAHPQLDLEVVTVRSIQRVSEIRVVHSAQRGKGRDERTVRERLAEIAGSLIPQRKPDYFPVPA